MASGGLRLVGGRDFNMVPAGQQAPGDSARTGWPFSPTLLARLQRVDADTLRHVENSMRAALRMSPLLEPA